MSVRKGDGIKTFKDTFWSKKRVEANISIKELADAIGIKFSTLASYLIGVSVPPSDVIRAMCDWFNVDYIEGEREFVKAHKEYDAQHSGKVVIASIKKSVNEPVTVIKEDVERKEDNMGNFDIRTEILRLAYNSKVSYDVFCELSETPVDKIRETLYNKVDYTTYRLIENILDGNVVNVENFDKWSI